MTSSLKNFTKSLSDQFLAGSAIALCPSMILSPSYKANNLGQSLNCHSDLCLNLSGATINL
ncbi:MAG: hypothetical protein QNJ33_10050 [Crocosphaera sp.]|nr:hypothetical protein [Crocosphaera sp.]